MRIIDWNISYNNTAEQKIELLEKVIGDDSFIAILQEVTPAQYEVIKKKFENICYSLDYRKPGKFDTKQRELGIAILCSEDIVIKKADVLTRCLLPDRTLLADLEYNGKALRVMGLHSITGISHKRAKSMQFLSFAESIDEFKPDIVGFDANEPAVDHYEIEQMEFFANHDKGMGARTFFTALKDANLRDAYLANYDKRNYVKGEPLATSHRFEINGVSKRYDFIFASHDIDISESKYLYDEAIRAGGDHAIICCEIDV